ncbi:22472_t:CDS:2, partial [Cetraspora pellucida]
AAKSTFSLSIQGLKQLPPLLLLTDVKTNSTMTKLPDKKEEIYSKEVWEEELYNVDQPQREQIPENDESDDYDEDNANELFDKLEYKREELEELESFSSDCVLSDKESAEETKKSRKMMEIESLAVYLAVMEEIPTGKKVSVDEKSTIEKQLNKIIEEGNVDDKYKEEIKELFKNNRTLFANGLKELG